jgi:hypothetical protein
MVPRAGTFDSSRARFQGITNLPFSAFVADRSRCRGVPKP